MKCFAFVLLVAILMMAIASALADEPTAPMANAAGSEARLAKSVSEKLDAQLKEFDALTRKLKDAVEKYTPNSKLDPAGELLTLDRFRAFAQNALESGRELAKLHTQWSTSAEKLAQILKVAPGYFKESARANRDRANAAKFEATKKQYALVADTWDALATRMAENAKDLNLDTDPRGLFAFVTEQNTFLTDFIHDLDALPRGSAVDQTAQRQLLEAIKTQAEKMKILTDELQRFHDKLVGKSPDAATTTKDSR
jgi:hypothetical protein